MEKLVAELALDDGLVSQNDLVELPTERRGPLAHEHVRRVDGLEDLAVHGHRTVLGRVGLLCEHKRDEKQVDEHNRWLARYLHCTCS